MSDAAVDVRARIDEIYRSESRRVLATLIRLLGDFDLAEEALHDAFVAALEQWPTEGVPANARTWLVSTGRFRGLDRLRRSITLDRKRQEIALLAEQATESGEDGSAIADDRLRLIFTCCHPALAVDAQIALTLRSVCGLTTEEIAHAFLLSPPALAQRIVRAKSKIRAARIPYEIPEPEQLRDRLDSVLQVIYLIFNEGYSSSSGERVTRADLAREAIRLGRLLLDLLDDREVSGLLGLMLLHEARRESRLSQEGEIVLLADQDRARWNRALITEGVDLVERSLRGGVAGPFGLQGAIAALHAEAVSADATDWRQITGLYDALLSIAGTPVVELNRAVAYAMVRGPAAGVALIDGILERGELQTYPYAHAARGELLRRLGRTADARMAFERALACSRQEPERRLLQRRIVESDQS